MANGNRIEQDSLVRKMMQSTTPMKNYYGMKFW